MAGVKGRSGRKANEQVFRHALMEKLNELDPKTGHKGIHRIAKKLMELAEDGDLGAIREVMDRVDGKPKQAIEASGPDGGDIPLGLRVVFRPTD